MARCCNNPRKKAQRNPTLVRSGTQAQEHMQGAVFRLLNEELYTSTGQKALEMMKDEPKLFSLYHEGFRTQSATWPIQPVTLAIDLIRSLSPPITVGDFGCGDAQIAKELQSEHVSVHSFDLVARPGVIACNIAHVPLDDSVLDVAVFCLALMGTDWPLFLLEAHRTLKNNGLVVIAEVGSRLRSSGSTPQNFCQKISKTFGWTPGEMRDENYFVFMTFRLPAEKRTITESSDQFRGLMQSAQKLLGACALKPR